eukprot:IDg8858t1
MTATQFQCIFETSNFFLKLDDPVWDKSYNCSTNCGQPSVVPPVHALDVCALICRAREAIITSIRYIHPSMSGCGRRDFVLGAAMSVKITQSVIERGGVAVDSMLCNTGELSIRVCAVHFGSSVIPLDIVLPPLSGWLAKRASVRVTFCERDESSNLPDKLDQQIKWRLR